MKKSILKGGALLLLLILLIGCSKEVKGANSVEPGYWRSSARPELEKVIEMKNKMNVGDDEFIVFYVRDDADYEPWAL